MPKRRAASPLASPRKRSAPVKKNNVDSPIVIFDDDDIIRIPSDSESSVEVYPAHAVDPDPYDNPIANSVCRAITQYGLLSPVPRARTSAHGVVDLIGVRPTTTELGDIDEDNVAIVGPKRRGRKVGSGPGGKEKKSTQQSTNRSPVKSRKEVTRTNQHERDVNRVREAQGLWVSRQGSQESSEIPASQQEQAVREKEQVLRPERRGRPDSTCPQAVVRRIIETHPTEIQEQTDDKHRCDVAELQGASGDESDDRFWVDEEFHDCDDEFLHENQSIVPVTTENLQVGNDINARQARADPMTQIVWNSFRVAVREAILQVQWRLHSLQRIGSNLF